MRLPTAWTGAQIAPPTKPSSTRVTAFFDAQEFLKAMGPQEPAQHGTPDAPKEEHVGAPLDMSDSVAGAGICPVTGTQMAQVQCGDHRVWLSLEDRIVLPIKDEQ